MSTGPWRDDGGEAHRSAHREPSSACSARARFRVRVRVRGRGRVSVRRRGRVGVRRRGRVRAWGRGEAESVMVADISVPSRAATP